MKRIEEFGKVDKLLRMFIGKDVLREELTDYRTWGRYTFASDGWMLVYVLGQHNMARRTTFKTLTSVIKTERVAPISVLASELEAAIKAANPLNARISRASVGPSIRINGVPYSTFNVKRLIRAARLLKVEVFHQTSKPQKRKGNEFTIADRCKIIMMPVAE